jgi:serine/threonine protein phosphatase PrpC
VVVTPGVTGACPACGWPTRPDDNFCEACRAELRQVVVSGEQAASAGACPSCPDAHVSPDGYCDSCGRRLPTNRDHAELDLGVLAGVTDRGLRHHRNEDAMALATADGPAGPVAAAVVCDGVSASPRADEASQAAAQAAVRALLDGARGGEDAEAACRRAVQSAREAVAGLTRGGPGRDSPAPGPNETSPDTPAATFVGAIMTREAVTLCWLGDSRAYWLGAGPDSAAERLTDDDSVAAELVAVGQVSEAEALALPQGHVVTRWIGADCAEPPHVTRFEPPGPGVLMLCSDGLWNYQPEAAPLARLALPEALTGPLAAAGALVRFALGAGGMDNITVVLAPYPFAPPPGPPAMTST